MADYSDFLNSKQDYGASNGFDPLYMPDFLFDFQKALTEWAIRKGRAAIFADCGMGKTPMQLVWADNVVRKTGKPVLILTPLAVTQQTLNEAEKFGIEAHRAMPNKAPTAIQVTNYERLHYFNSTDYAGVVCDESSILKNFDGAHKAEVTEFMRRVPYRLLCTATAAPNDWYELGTSSEALGYLGYTDMLGRFFTNKQGTVKSYGHTRFTGYKDDDFRLKGHAEEPFWKWIASWARASRMPADLGFDNDGFILPPMNEVHTVVKAVRPREGMLFDVVAANFFEEREVTRRTIQERCEAAAAKVAEHDVSIVWCHLNDEGDLLEKIIPNSRQVAGKHSDEYKEEAAMWFTTAKGKRVLICKPKIFGLGLNFQHCAHVTYFPTHSYEQYYQAVRRCWRFGQKQTVTVDLIDTDGGERVMDNLMRKSKAADEMFANLVKHMNHAINIDKYNQNGKDIKVPTWLQSKS
jgi:hypothetical protein